jgi:hypothetical protein
MFARGRGVQSIAMAGLAALALAAAAPADGPSGQNAAYLRIAVSEKSVVYLQVQGLELRAATSVAGLQSAEPMKMRLFGGTAAQAREFALPIPADQLPAGTSAVKLGLWLDRRQPDPKSPPGPYFTGKLTLCRTDDQKAQWQYVTSLGSMAGAEPEKAPSIRLPSLDDLKLTVTAVPSQGRVAVGLTVSSGSMVLSEVRKDGKPVQVSVSVMDSAGATIAQKSGTLADFGFS